MEAACSSCSPSIMSAIITRNAACAFTLALSGEHTGFTFERDLAKAENMIRLHSDGENAVALRALRGGACGTLASRGDARELLDELWRRV